jgi:hypothetical protein
MRFSPKFITRSREIGETSRETSLAKWDSLLCLHSTHLDVKIGTAREKVPPLRSSKLAHTFSWLEGKKVVVHSDYFKRYGPKREEIIRYVTEQPSTVEVAELQGRFGARTSGPGRFFKTWVKPMVDDGIFVGNSARVEKATNWLETLERVRSAGMRRRTTAASRRNMPGAGENTTSAWRVKSVGTLRSRSARPT